MWCRSGLRPPHPSGPSLPHVCVGSWGSGPVVGEQLATVLPCPVSGGPWWSVTWEGGPCPPEGGLWRGHPPGASRVPCRGHLAPLHLYHGLRFHGNPLLQESQAHESFSTIIILKNVAPLSLPTRRAVSMETGVETVGRRGSQVRPFPWMCAGPAEPGPGPLCSPVSPRLS